MNMPISQQLLSSRCYIPHVTNNYISYGDVLSKLEVSFSYPLTLITAPAGFGKSTSTIHALRSLAQSFVWYEAHHQDNNPRKFWAYVIYAIQQSYPDFGQSLIHQIDNQADDTHINYEALLYHFNQEIDNLPNRIILVIDNYHNIANPIIHQSIQTLIKYLSPQLRFVILTRQIPPFNLTSLRLQHLVSELSQVDLQFTSTAIQRFFLQATGTKISKETLEQIEGKTEGWGIALQLIRMTTEKFPQELDELLQNIDMNKLGLFDYLAEEVIEHVDHDTKTFLLITSVLDTFTVELSNYLLNIDNSLDIIEELLQKNLFIVQLDIQGQYYRYHNLFADFLRSHLSSEEFQDIRQKAALWFASKNMYLEAVDYVLEIDDFSSVIPLIKEAAYHMLNRRDFEPVTRWFEYIPEEHIQQNLDLTIVRAWVFIAQLDLSSAIQQIKHAEHLASLKPPTTQTQYDLQVVRTIFYYATMNFEKTKGLLKEIQAIFEQLEPIQQVNILMVSCGLHHYYGQFNDMVDLIESHTHLIWEDDAGVSHLFILENYIDGLTEIGQLQKSKRLVEQFLRRCEQNAIWDKFKGMILDDYARIHFYEHQLEQAKTLVTQAIASLHQEEFYGPTLSCLYLLSEITAFEGNEQQAINYLRPTSQVDVGILMEWMQQEIKNAHMRIYDLVGQYERIKNWFKHWEGDFPLRTRFIPIIVHYIANQYPPDEAIKTLIVYRKRLQANGLITKLIVLDLALARLYFVLDEHQHGQQYLANAISMAFQDGYVQAFVEEGEWLNSELPALRDIAPHFVDDILEHLPKQDNIEFTKRETEIVPYLKHGLTNSEIANELGVSVNTIKYHLKQIFRKLEVDNRIQAVQKLHQHFAD